MPGRTITAIFSREWEARRAADAVRALGYGDGRARLEPWSGSAGAGFMLAGFMLVVSPDARDEDKLVGVIDHYGPARLACGTRAGRPGAERAPAGAAPPSVADRLRAAAAALRRVHGGRPEAGVPPLPAASGRDEAGHGAGYGNGRRRSLPETEAGG